MKAVLTVAEMRAVDAASSVPEQQLIERAGSAVYFAARRMLGGTYGRKVIVIAGPGNNGADGRVAARLLKVRGVRVTLLKPGEQAVLPVSDLIIDAAFGTGFHGEYESPDTSGAPVLAVDIASGVNGDTGEACQGAVVADRTVTFAALKPGHLFADGPEHSGEIDVVDIGLDVSQSSIELVDERSVVELLPELLTESHKWKTAVAVIAGSPGMYGAPSFCAAGASRAGAGMVQLFVPGSNPTDIPATEAVVHPALGTDWAGDVLKASERVKAIVIGPGLGRTDEVAKNVRAVVEQAPVPVVVDADALFALSNESGRALLRSRRLPTVLTPHDGEFERLTGSAPATKRWVSAQELARETNSVVMLKGSTSIIASPDGRTIINNTGDARLATAGTGDVYAGMVAALLAQDLDPVFAATCAAYVHGAAARLGFRRGFVAGDLPVCVARWLSDANIQR